MQIEDKLKFDFEKSSKYLNNGFKGKEKSFRVFRKKSRWRQKVKNSFLNEIRVNEAPSEMTVRL